MLSILLGLLLLVQGLAVSAAPLMVMAPANAEIILAAEPATEAEMPCHQQIDEPAPATDAAPACPCCDGDCPDMLACAMAQAAMPSTLALHLPRRMTTVPAMVATSFVPHSSNSLLRPPISLHS